MDGVGWGGVFTLEQDWQHLKAPCLWSSEGVWDNQQKRQTNELKKRKKRKQQFITTQLILGSLYSHRSLQSSPLGQGSGSCQAQTASGNTVLWICFRRQHKGNQQVYTKTGKCVVKSNWRMVFLSFRIQIKQVCAVHTVDGWEHGWAFWIVLRQ